MDKRRITATDILVTGLVLVMVINIFWFFNKKPLTKNLNLEDSIGNIRFSFSVRFLIIDIQSERQYMFFLYRSPLQAKYAADP